MMECQRCHKGAFGTYGTRDPMGSQEYLGRKLPWLTDWIIG
jgi:hypothetical protein